MPQCIGEDHVGDCGRRCGRPTVNDLDYCADHMSGERGESPASGGGPSSEGGDERQGEGRGGGRDGEVVRSFPSRHQGSQGEERDRVRTNLGPALPRLRQAGSRDIGSDSVLGGRRLLHIREDGAGEEEEEEKQQMHPQGELGPCPRAGDTVRNETSLLGRFPMCRKKKQTKTHQPSTRPGWGHRRSKLSSSALACWLEC